MLNSASFTVTIPSIPDVNIRLSLLLVLTCYCYQFHYTVETSQHYCISQRFSPDMCLTCSLYILYVCHYVGIEVQVYGGTRVTWDEETSYFKGFSVKTEHKNVDLFLQDTIKIDVDPNKTKTGTTRDP